MNWIAGKTGFFDDYLFLLTFTYNWQVIYTILPTGNVSTLNHLWTLSIEEQFYIFFPLLFLFTSAAVAVAAGLLYAGTYIWINRQNGAVGAEALRNIVSGILGREIFVYTVVTLVAVALVAACVAARRWTCILALGPLVHVAPSRSADNAPIHERVAQFVLVWTLTVAVATLSFRYFESRFTLRRPMLGASAVAR